MRHLTRFLPETLTLLRPITRHRRAIETLTGSQDEQVAVRQAADPVAAARVHKQLVRRAATRRVASLALLLLTFDEGAVDAQTETRLVCAAWSQAARSLGHESFVRTRPATFADLRALAA